MLWFKGPTRPPQAGFNPFFNVQPTRWCLQHDSKVPSVTSWCKWTWLNVFVQQNFRQNIVNFSIKYPQHTPNDSNSTSYSLPLNCMTRLTRVKITFSTCYIRPYRDRRFTVKTNMQCNNIKILQKLSFLNSAILQYCSCWCAQSGRGDRQTKQGGHKVGEKNSEFSTLYQSHKLTFP